VKYSFIQILEQLAPAILGGIITSIVMLLTARLSRRKLPVAYSVAVVGFPRSGKTTLITAMFGELFAARILGYSVFPRGESTIERINSDLEKLELGKSLGPTKDQDLFAYRADVIREGFPFSRSYKVEIGDFPGEDSIAFTENYGDWFHQTPYFRWVMEADAFIFVVDLAHALNPVSSREYSARISSAVRAAWQRLQENHFQGERTAFLKPVALVFMKADLLGERAEVDAASASDEIDFRIMELGSGGRRYRVEVGDVLLQEGRQHVELLFSELLGYLASQARNFKVIFASAFAYRNGRRLGIPELLAFILPRPGRIQGRPSSPLKAERDDGRGGRPVVAQKHPGTENGGAAVQ